MHFHKIRKKFLYIVSIILLLAIIAWVVSLFIQTPPTEKIEAGRKAIAQAIKEEAQIYSATELNLARKNWEDAMNNWKINNNKNALSRNYEQTIILAHSAITNAQQAINNSIQRKKEYRKEIETCLPTLRKKIAFIKSVKEKMPVNHTVWNKFTPIILKMEETESAFKRNDLLSAKKNLKTLTDSVNEIEKQTTNLINNYFNSYNEWINLDKEIRQKSITTGSITIVVDKFSRKCIVYKYGKKHKEYDIELGINWLGHKIQKGDRATPEGKYSITSKKQGRNTIYHKALLINFPNSTDISNFKKNKANGTIPKNAIIGGTIEFHGGGGRGIDWTDGCIALTNKDMNSLYALCSVGTPVAIVGSLTPIEKIFDLAPQ